jgi:hypothetical protein
MSIHPITEIGYAVEYMSDTLAIYNYDNRPWKTVPVPRRRLFGLWPHRHFPQTIAYGHSWTELRKCPCGKSSLNGGAWTRG